MQRLRSPALRPEAVPEPSAAIRRHPHPARGLGTSLPVWLLVLGVIMAPILVPPTLTNAVPGDLVNLLLILVSTALFWRYRVPLRVPLGMSYLLVLLGGIVALTHSVAPSEAAVAIVQDAYLFVWFLVVVNLILVGGDRTARLMALTWSVTGVAMALVVWVPTLWATPENLPLIFGYEMVDFFGRSMGTFRDPNLAGNYIAIALFVLWASPRPRSLVLKLLLTPLFLLAIQSTESITALAILGGGAAVSVVLGLIAGRTAKMAATLTVVALGVIVLASLPPDALGAGERVTQELGATETFGGSLGRTNTSLELRVERWKEALQLFGSETLVGIGPSTADEALEARGAPVLGELHMDYLAALIERGVMGLIGVVSLFAVGLYWSLNVGTNSHLRRRGWRPPALAGAMVCVLMSAVSLETLHFRHVWLLFALIIGLGLLTPAQQARGTPTRTSRRILVALGAPPPGHTFTGAPDGPR